MYRTIFTGLLMLAILPGCSSKHVTTDYAVGVDFSQFESFQYMDKGNSLAASSPLNHQRIVAALQREMTNAGLTETESDPDLVVTYYGSTSERVSFNTTHVGYGWGASSWHHGHRTTIGVSSSQTTQTVTTRGTLLVDIWDAQRNELVWRGQLEDTLSGETGALASVIDRGIEELFLEFPPR